MIDILIRIPGPQFLLMFAGLSFFCILAAWWWTDKTEQFQIDLLPSDLRRPSEPSMLSAALLRGKQNAVIRTVLFDLWSRNMIRINGNGAETRVESVPSMDPNIIGGAVHKAIYTSAFVPKKISEVFSDTKLKTTIENCLNPISERLKRLHLLRNEDDCARALLSFMAAFTVIFGIGATKMALGFMRGRPVGFLVALLIISVIALFFAVKPGITIATRFGQHYLNSLKQEFQELRGDIIRNKLPSDISPAFAVAIFGAGILAGAEYYKPFSDAFAVSAGSSGGCGSGCSGGCGGGGGGGCGGCGGGD